MPKVFDKSVTQREKLSNTDVEQIESDIDNVTSQIEELQRLVDQETDETAKAELQEKLNAKTTEKTELSQHVSILGDARYSYAQGMHTTLI